MGNLIKATPLLMFALLIDGFQSLVALALSVLTAFPGTIGGAAAGSAGGAYLCSDLGSSAASACAAAGGAILGLLGSIPGVNQTLGVVTEPVGMALGFAIGICISFTLGSVLTLFLFLLGLLDKKAAVLTYMGEVLPGFDTLPAWTGLVVRCVYKKTKDELVTGIVGSVAIFASALAIPSANIGNTAGERTLMRGAAARPQPRYDQLDADENEAVIPQARTTGSFSMQDVRLRPSAPVPYAKAI